MTMKFALIRPWEFDAIYFETEELAKAAKAQIDQSTGREVKTIIARVANDKVYSDVTYNLGISEPVAPPAVEVKVGKRVSFKRES